MRTSFWTYSQKVADLEPKLWGYLSIKSPNYHLQFINLTAGIYEWLRHLNIWQDRVGFKENEVRNPLQGEVETNETQIAWSRSVVLYNINGSNGLSASRFTLHRLSELLVAVWHPVVASGSCLDVFICLFVYLWMGRTIKKNHFFYFKDHYHCCGGNYGHLITVYCLVITIYYQGERWFRG